MDECMGTLIDNVWMDGSMDGQSDRLMVRWIWKDE